MRVTSTLKNILGPTQSAGLDDGAPSVTIRYARPDDSLALLELAYLDSRSAPGRSARRCPSGASGVSTARWPHDPAYESSTSRTLRARLRSVNGFSMKAVFGRISPFLNTASSE